MDPATRKRVRHMVGGPLPPSSFHVLHGAHLIANLSASNELVGKADYRRSLVAQQSARGICGYVYSSCGIGESSQDVVFGGHALVAEDGVILAESKRFSLEGELTVVDVDVEHLRLDRERTTSFADSLHALPPMPWRRVDVSLPPYVTKPFRRTVDPSPFIPRDDAERNRRTEEIFAIQTSGLVKRMSHSGIHRLVLGLSGGLDSTLAPAGGPPGVRRPGPAARRHPRVHDARLRHQLAHARQRRQAGAHGRGIAEGD
jgi:NAD+ synthase (glutamine-hydrolysing)